MVWHGMKQEIFAAQPVEGTVALEVNTMVRQPEALEDVALTVPGDIVPLKKPKEGEALLSPSKIAMMSEPDCVLNAVKSS